MATETKNKYKITKTKTKRRKKLKKHAKTATTAQMLNGKWGWHIKKGELCGPEESEKDREPGT